MDDVKHLVLSSAIRITVSFRECIDRNTAQGMCRGNATHVATGERQLHLRECDGDAGESADDGFGPAMLPSCR